MTLRKVLLAAAGVVAITGSAHASIILTLDNVVGNGSGAYDYTYLATLSADEAMVTNDYVTLYDFGPLSAGSSLPTAKTGLMDTNFTYTTANSGPTPVGVTPNDDGAIANYTATYAGPGTDGTTLGNGAQGNLGSFTLTSDNPVRAITQLKQASSAQHITGGQDSNVTSAEIPTTATPEPASLALIGTALFGAGLLRRRNRKS